MNYPSLSLRQELIDKVLSGAKYGTQRQTQKTPSPKYVIQRQTQKTPSPEYGIQRPMQKAPSPEANRMKKLRKRQKESRMQNAVVVEECDQCEFKSSQFKAVYRHRREKHLVTKQKCTDCGYSNIYPNRVKTHFNRVHRGEKRRRYEKCRRESCAYAGTTDCSELQIHSQWFCKQCQLYFVRSESFKSHNDQIHEGLIFSCAYCDEYENAKKSNLERHILSKHSSENTKIQKRQNRTVRFCKEEGCTYKDSTGNMKRHIEAKHEGIVRFKCHVMNCRFRSSEHKELRRHAKTHEKESSALNLKPNRIQQDIN